MLGKHEPNSANREDIAISQARAFFFLVVDAQSPTAAERCNNEPIVFAKNLRVIRGNLLFADDHVAGGIAAYACDVLEQRITSLPLRRGSDKHWHSEVSRCDHKGKHRIEQVQRHIHHAEAVVVHGLPGSA